MSTFRQLVSRYKRKTKRVRTLVPALKKCPQRRGVVQLTFIQSPKKPNSAKRKVAKVKLSTGRVISCYIPGIGHKLTKHSVLLVRGGRAQDLIGVRYKPIHGKFDFAAPVGRISRRSKYGLSNKFKDRNTDSVVNVEATEAQSAFIRNKALKAKKARKARKARRIERYRSKRFSSSIFANIKPYLLGR
jgi:small subunit ribosomal protein S12